MLGSLGLRLPYKDLESLFSELVPNAPPEIVCVACWSSNRLADVAEKFGSALLTGGAVTAGSFPCGLVAITPTSLVLLRLGLTWGNKLSLDFNPTYRSKWEVSSYAFKDIPSVSFTRLDATCSSPPRDAPLTLGLGVAPKNGGPGITQIDLPERRLMIMVPDSEVVAPNKETHAMFHLAGKNSQRGLQLAERLVRCLDRGAMSV